MRFVRTRWTWHAYFLSGFFTFSINIQGNIIPFLRDELQLSYSAVSLHPSALAAGMMATGFFTGRVVATLGRRWSCLVGVCGCICGFLAICAARSPASSIGGCAVVGLTGGMLPAIVGGLLADLHRGAREQAFTECGAVTYACAITANLATGVFAALAVGWRGALLFGAACGLALIFTFPGNAVPEASRPAVRASERLPPASWAYLVMLGFGVALEMTMLLWSPAYLEQVVGLPRTTAVTAAAAFPAAMLVGRTAGAVLVQRVRPEILHPSALCLIAPGFLAFWGGFSPLISVFGLFLAGLAIALLYPLSLSFAVGAAGAAGNSASARSGFAAGAAVLTVPVALGALADRVGLSLAYLAAPILASIVLLCFAAARLMEQQHARRIAKGLIGSSEGAEARRK